MTDSASITTDFGDVLKGLDGLDAALKSHLARSMAVAGGSVIRDEAKLRAPVDDGTLRDAIYLAHKDAESRDGNEAYSVTWNKRKAPHGHLLEFGHWQPRQAVKLRDGTWITTRRPQPEPKWVAARPFLRPAFEATKQRAMDAMIKRAQERLPELLSKGYESGD